MKRTYMKLLVVTLAAALLAGCQATPEQEIVVQKDLEQMIEKAQETPEASQTPGITLAQRLDAPETCQTSFSNEKGSVTVNVDAKVVIPETDKIATAKVKEQTFSQETADKLMELLLEGQTLYEWEGYLTETKAEIQERLVELYAMQAGTIPVAVDGTVEESIEIMEQMLETAPDERVRNPALTTFHKRDMGDDPRAPYDYIEGVVEINGGPAHFLVENCTEINRISVEFNRYMDAPRYYETLDNLNGKLQIDESLFDAGVTAEAAQAQADAIVRELGLEYMACVRVEPAVCAGAEPAFPEGGTLNFSDYFCAWVVRYERVVEGIPISFTSATGGQVADEENYAQPWPYEALYFIIDGSGIVEFKWTSPYTEPEIVTSDTNLLSFSEVQAVFEKMVLINYSFYDGGTLELDINNVQLGLMRVTDTGERDSGILIPVWDFFGNITAVPDNEEPYQWGYANDSLLTINAIDGSVIDRGLGY